MPGRQPRQPGAKEGPLLRHDRDGVSILTLNRPRQRNALSLDLLSALRDAFDALGEERSTRVVVLTGTAPAFCAGHDLREMQAARGQADGGAAFFEDTFAQCSAVMQAIVDCPRPVIAAVEGIATAAGCQLVATCDLAVAGALARFATPGVDIGLFCSTPMVALSRNVAPKHAMEMLLTGEMVDAETALRMGLVNRVTRDGAALEGALELAGRIARKSPRVLRIGKEAFYRQREMGLADAYAYTSRVMVANMLGEDATEGVGAFLDKRPPRWPQD